jgi:hypothetical protein
LPLERIVEQPLPEDSRVTTAILLREERIVKPPPSLLFPFSRAREESKPLPSSTFLWREDSRATAAASPLPLERIVEPPLPFSLLREERIVKPPPPSTFLWREEAYFPTTMIKITKELLVVDHCHFSLII